MAFSIEPLQLSSFLQDSRIKLPRFQRKATWNDVQKFKLCISVFKGYPVGVVIYNETKDSNWLLDGRQRRNALKTASEDPVALYQYAKAYLKFKPTSTEDEIRDIFWKEITKFLEEDKVIEDKSNTNTSDGDLDNSEQMSDFENNIDIDPEEQKGNLKILLKIILMVHCIKKGVSEWEKRFDFSDFSGALRYIDRTTKRVNPKKLKKELLNFYSESPALNINDFINFFCPDSDKFAKYLEQKYETIQDNIRTIKDAEEVFSRATIGVIRLKNVTPLDAQNIFSLVNSGGTQLKAEELLSAKPFWNIQVSGNLLNVEVRSLVDNLYKDLDIPGEDNQNTAVVVRWDICATLLDRIDKNHLFFPIFQHKEKEVNMDKITLGFKLLSADISGGISAKHIEKMEREDNWEGRVQSLIDDVNMIAEILLDVNFYRDLKGWRKTLFDLFGHAPTLEFITILRKNWIELGRPIVDGKQRKSFVHNSLVLLDKLFYEYANSQWRGSSDSKVARDIENITERLIPITMEEWQTWIKNVSQKNTDYKRLEAVLYYCAILQLKRPDVREQITYDVDHIIPQSLIEASSDESLVVLKNTLGNLALFPHKANIKKNDKTLDAIDKDLQKEVAKYSDIEIADFDKYSDITHLREVCEYRTQNFLSVIENARNKLLANNKLVEQ